MAGSDHVSCGLCHFNFTYGAKVCQGCQGTIIYGPTAGEVAESAKTWSLFYGLGTAFVLYLIPFIMSTNWDFKISTGWGLGAWGLIPVVGAFLWGYSTGMTKAHEAHSREVRTFRRM